VLTRAAADEGNANLTLYHTRNSNAAVKSALQNGDGLGRIAFQGATNSSTVLETAEIQAVVNGTVSSSSLPTAKFTAARTVRLMSGSQPCFFEVQVALDRVHRHVADDTFFAQAEQRFALDPEHFRPRPAGVVNCSSVRFRGAVFLAAFTLRPIRLRVLEAVFVIGAQAGD
jgi:hypothetical protein